MEEIINGGFENILLILLALSEAMALIPGVKANSIFQFVVGILQKLAGK